MEMADALVVTKADGDNVKPANLAATQYRNALHLFPPNENEWIPPVFTCSSQTGDNLEKVHEVIDSFRNKKKSINFKLLIDTINTIIIFKTIFIFFYYI